MATGRQPPCESPAFRAWLAPIVALVLLFLAGCITEVSPEKANKLDLQKTGLVLATTEATGLAKDVKHVLYDFYIRPIDPDRRYSTYYVSSGKAMWLLEIPPGRYRIDDWFLGSGTSRAFSASTGFEFDVRPGEVTYIGHFKISVSQAKNMLGLRVIPQGQPVLENQYSKAEKLFRNSYPSLNATVVRDAAPRETFSWEISDEQPVNLGMPPPVIK